MATVLDVEKTTLLDLPDGPDEPVSIDAEVVIVGGGLGGVAAALAACQRGRSVVLLEETSWLGGQATSQGVSALDENSWIETTGGTALYAEFRRRIRDGYRGHTLLTPAARAHPHLNPGNGWVSRLCFEPLAAVSVLQDMLQPFLPSPLRAGEGRLQVFCRTKAVRADTEGDRIAAVFGLDLDTGAVRRFTGAYFLDATELGDLLPLAGVEHVVGAEAHADTGEPHAREVAHPECVQSWTYTFAVEFCPGENHVIDPPPRYKFWREHQPYTLRHFYGDERGWVSYRMFTTGEGTYGPFWTYRRLIDAGQFDDPRYPHDIALINWPGNDFRDGNLLVEDPAAQLEALRQAKELSLGFLFWLQTECPRDDGGQGYPELKLRPDVMGTADGLSMFPYIREARRIRALKTVREQEVAARYQTGRRATPFSDSVGLGFYSIDLHPGPVEETPKPYQTCPFQIPLGALIPQRVTNLLAACKNIGTTHITNGCYRLHPIEWNIGEAAGALAAFCLRTGLTPQAVHADLPQLRAFQIDLVESGVPLVWFEDLLPEYPHFAAVQYLALAGDFPLPSDHLRCELPGDATVWIARYAEVRALV